MFLVFSINPKHCPKSTIWNENIQPRPENNTLLECISNKIWNNPESSTDRKPKGYVSVHVHKKIEMIFREKAMVSNEQKLRLDEHNKLRFKLSHPVPR